MADASSALGDWTTYARQHGLDTVLDIGNNGLQPLPGSNRAPRRVATEAEEFRVVPFHSGPAWPGTAATAPSSSVLSMISPWPIFLGLLIALVIALALWLSSSTVARRQRRQAAAQAIAQAALPVETASTPVVLNKGTTQDDGNDETIRQYTLPDDLSDKDEASVKTGQESMDYEQQLCAVFDIVDPKELPI